MIILPGTKNTIEDLLELRRRGMDAAIVRHARAGGLVMGVCGGYQMLGTVLRDPMHVESRVPEVSGLGLLDMEVTFAEEKRTRQATGCVEDADGWLQSLNGALVDGYEIHAGQNRFGARCVPWMRIGGEVDGVRNAEGNVLGSYLHGLFDDGQLFGRIARAYPGTEGHSGRGGSAHDHGSLPPSGNLTASPRLCATVWIWKPFTRSYGGNADVDGFLPCTAGGLRA